MKWHYDCPNCVSESRCDWQGRTGDRPCGSCKVPYSPPSPASDGAAYVDTHEWPVEMEQAVHASRGRKCTVPGCSRDADTLDHHVPHAKGGRTSVNNLFPMCQPHNQSKGDQDYAIWLVSLSLMG